MRVLGTPENPKPPTRIIDDPFMSLIASCADGTILSITLRDDETEKFRRHTENGEAPNLAFMAVRGA